VTTILTIFLSIQLTAFSTV